MKNFFFILCLALICLPSLLLAQEETAHGGCVKEIRGARHQGFDRIVFSLHGAVVPIPNQPQDTRVEGEDILSTMARYVAVPQAYSGDRIRMKGTAFLEISWMGVNWTECTSVPRKALNLKNVTEVVKSEEFEGHVGYIIGTKGKKRAKISTLSNPDRLIVDILW